MRRLKSSLDPQTLEDVFNFLCQYYRQFGYSPTMREVSEACYMSRPNMYRYLDRLEGQGRITRSSGIARSITITAPCPDE
jgi:DNA-binding MarR family transcriptional regulator